MTTREKILMEKYRDMLEKPMISIGDIDDLMAQVDKLLQNYRQTVESRDSWKAKYKLRNDDAKDYAEEITRITKLQQHDLDEFERKLKEFKDVA